MIQSNLGYYLVYIPKFYFTILGRGTPTPPHKKPLPKSRYLVDEEGFLDLEAMRYALGLAGKKSYTKELNADRSCNQKVTRLIDQFKVGSLVYAKVHSLSVWDSKWKYSYRKIKISCNRSTTPESTIYYRTRKVNTDNIH